MGASPARAFRRSNASKNGWFSGKRILPQKQNGLYTVAYHPIGGCPAPGKFRELYETIKDMETR